MYIGSALAERGASSLGNRLQRHCSRTPPLPPHEIRQTLLSRFRDEGIQYSRNPSPKKLFWNIDHILNRVDVEVRRIYLIRSPRRIENTLSAFFLDSDRTAVTVKGLGANDSPGHTHLQSIVDMENPWWDDLTSHLQRFL